MTQMFMHESDCEDVIWMVVIILVQGPAPFTKME